AASAASVIFCFGSLLIPNFISPTCCGRISVHRNWRRPSPISPAGSAGSGARRSRWNSWSSCIVLKRVLTALVLAPLALAVIWLMPTAGVAVLFGIVVMLGGAEWARLIGLVSTRSQLIFLVGLLLLLALGWIFYRSDWSNVPVVALAA